MLCWALLWSAPARAAEFVYVVQPGDHLWNIAQRYLQRPTQALDLLRRHHIADARRLQPGTRLHIPQQWLRLQTASVQLAALVGEVSIETPAAGLRAAVAGEWLQAPAVLRTGPGGSAKLQFSDGSHVMVLRDSELRLHDSLTRLVDQAGMVTLELLRGGLENDVQPRKPQGGRFEIRTPAAVAAVRGTRFRVHADVGDALQTRAEVLTGAVRLFNSDGQVTAEAAQGSVVRVRLAPQPPVALLPPPDLSCVPTRVERLPFDLFFPALDGATSYRVQIAPGPAFDVTIADATTRAPRLGVRELADGHYMLRVRAIDAQGLEGLPQERRLELHARPEPPLLIEPVPGAVTADARPQFRWTERAADGAYRLQLSRAGRFEPIVEQVVDGGRATPAQDLAPGSYQWRVASIDGARGQGPFSDAQAFRRTLPGPDTQTASDDDGLRLRWSAQTEAARYRLQVARDARFEQPELDVLSEAPQYGLTALAPGIYYVRVQAIATTGETGAWGGTHTFTVAEPRGSRWPWLMLLLPLVLL
ncbi:hypothetical protein ASF43_09160 [Pseudorhodoferax sp. Leaf267]|nr:hypothetical protein ASF43_09160 [Pseudorhodoferax sp. Leaf267]